MANMLTRLRHARSFCTIPTYEAGPRIYSCKVRNKIPLELPTSPALTTSYTCGPTVYDSAHIGHASCYVRVDILQRILKQHFRVNLVTAMNITDIDDKIIRRASEQGKPWQELSRHYEQEFWSDLRRLNVQTPDIILRVTDHIPAIVAFIDKLLSTGYAYKSTDDSIYFETSKHPQYGKLQNIPSEEGPAVGKKSAADFALWKASKPGEPFWESPFGPGRPGWHIECSTLATQIFGSRLDFHAGGLDLRFPHHENEEAQSCCYHQVQDWVRYWIHTGQLHLEGQTHKMSKSLKNTVSIRELLDGYSADEFRMLCLLSHYRSVIEYGTDTMAIATNVLKKLRSFIKDSKAYVAGIKPATSIDAVLLQTKLAEVDKKVDEFLCNDFNTANAVTSLADLASVVNKSINQRTSELVSASESGAVQGAMNYIRDKLALFGLQSFVDDAKVTATDNQSGQSVEHLIEALVKLRSTVRRKAMETKDRTLFDICDQMRDELKLLNVEVKDHGKLTSWSYVTRKFLIFTNLATQLGHELRNLFCC
ncbi:probable cysteine--tRNA ligase, mitochondrial isoform X2 [Wyeomyia smithii]|uniref:probable cysteine--tRNA ligase, mitochondrial isoform X2 n=1 Tax=Wyeomyia smithii TaxID=174621 RepID=UPI002467C320|nr:probable cysteine--tRNA ligase, mitochondrial isoform X2 [Wyeomyia smithii]